jgi:hypothetical protein
MKRLTVLVVTAILTLLVTTAVAGMPVTLTVNDSGIDFETYGEHTSYIQLAFEDHQLEVIMSDTQLMSVLPAIDITVPPVNTEDLFGNEVTAGNIEQVDEVELIRYGNNFRGIQVHHPGVSLEEVSTSYLAAFAKMGFTSTLDSHSNHNVQIYYLDQGDDHLRAVFHRLGGEVEAFLYGL